MHALGKTSGLSTDREKSFTSQMKKWALKEEDKKKKTGKKERG